MSSIRVRLHARRAIDTATEPCKWRFASQSERTLIAGSYVQATLPINVDARRWWFDQRSVVPADGTRVALVDDAGRVHLALVKLGTDFGDRVQVLSGLKASDRWCSIRRFARDGDVVTPAAKEAKVQ